MNTDRVKIAPPRAFTLIELLASMAILALIMVMLFSAFEQVSKAWTNGESRVETYTQGRAVLDLMSRELTQAIATNTIPFFGQKTSITLGTIAPVPTLHLDSLAFVASIGDDTSDGMDLMEVVYRLSRRKAGVPESTMGGTTYFNDADPGPYKLIRRITGFSGTAANCRNYGLFSDSGVLPWDFYGPPNPNPNWPETSDKSRTAVLAENVVSLEFQFQDAQAPIPGHPAYWNSTTAIAWQNELAGGIPPNSGPAMQDRPPAVVVIILTMLDSKAALKYRMTPVANVQERIYQQSYREFRTSVSIPNRQP